MFTSITVHTRLETHQTWPIKGVSCEGKALLGRCCSIKLNDKSKLLTQLHQGKYIVLKLQIEHELLHRVFKKL